MKECPYCKEPMDIGYVPTDEIPPQWIPETEKPALIKFHYAKTSKKIIYIDSLLGKRAIAYHCNQCGIILLNEEK